MHAHAHGAVNSMIFIVFPLAALASLFLGGDLGRVVSGTSTTTEVGICNAVANQVTNPELT